MVNFKCPVCKARFKGEVICHRCGNDLTPLIRVIDQAIHFYNLALQSAKDEDWNQALILLHHAQTWFQGLTEVSQLKSAILYHLE